MRLVGILSMFAGYTLLYAAVARGGVFATDPWNGILYDAYGVSLGSSVGAAAGALSSPGASSSLGSAAGALSPSQRYAGFTG